jgi:hypothetical protein
MQTRLVETVEALGKFPALYALHIAGGAMIGGLERYHDKRTKTYSYKAYFFFDSDKSPTKFLGTFYDRDGGEQAAIDAIVKHYTINYTN